MTVQLQVATGGWNYVPRQADNAGKRSRGPTASSLLPGIVQNSMWKETVMARRYNRQIRRGRHTYP